MTSNSNIPPTAGMNVASKVERINFKIASQKALINSYSWQTCINCEYWNMKDEKCDKFDAKPPLDVVLVGCSEYNEAIPF